MASHIERGSAARIANTIKAIQPRSFNDLNLDLISTIYGGWEKDAHLIYLT
jgi:hypothetical protein